MSRLGLFTAAMLAVSLAAHIGCRFLPDEWYSYRAWEPLAAKAHGFGAFEQNRVYRGIHTYGDLAHFGNMPAVRQYRAETFTTDRCGNRNPPEAFDVRPVDVLMVGSSFTLGSGTTDSLTLPSLLRSKTRLSVYSMAGRPPWANWDPVLAFVDKLQMRPGGTVVVEVLERLDMPAAQPSDGTDWPAELARQCGQVAPSPAKILRTYASDTWYTSPLAIVSSDLLRWMQNGNLFPNSYKDQVVEGTLKDGSPILFYPQEVDSGYRTRDIVLPVDLCAELNSRLKPRGIRLIVVLVPNKYTVYYPLLRSPSRGRPSGIEYLAALAKGLARRHIATVNLTPTFLASAQEEFAHGRMIYWKDDTHWNSDGIALAADLLTRKIRAR